MQQPRNPSPGHPHSAHAAPGHADVDQGEKDEIVVRDSGGKSDNRNEHDTPVDNDVDQWLGDLADAMGNFNEEDEEEAAAEAMLKRFKKKPGAIRLQRIDYASITPEEFRERFMSKNMPAVLGRSNINITHVNLIT